MVVVPAGVADDAAEVKHPPAVAPAQARDKEAAAGAPPKGVWERQVELAPLRGDGLNLDEHTLGVMLARAATHLQGAVTHDPAVNVFLTQEQESGQLQDGFALDLAARLQQVPTFGTLVTYEARGRRLQDHGGQSHCSHLNTSLNGLDAAGKAGLGFYPVFMATSHTRALGTWEFIIF